jgi:hypothetical protein
VKFLCIQIEIVAMPIYQKVHAWQWDNEQTTINERDISKFSLVILK